jgi:hypothetical protein
MACVCENVDVCNISYFPTSNEVEVEGFVRRNG